MIQSMTELPHCLIHFSGEGRKKSIAGCTSGANGIDYPGHGDHTDGADNDDRSSSQDRPKEGRGGWTEVNGTL